MLPHSNRNDKATLATHHASHARLRIPSSLSPASALVSLATVHDWLITGISQLLTLRGSIPRRGKSLNDLGIIRDGAILVSGDRVAAIGPRRRIENHRLSRKAEKIDLGGKVVLPGFVDSHTHLIFPRSRALEYEDRIAGATYEQIAKKGGGIRSTVKHCRSASVDSLKARALKNLDTFAAHGTTTIESKSGYGLDWKSELKILLLLAALHQEHPIDIHRTFLGAHVIPAEYKKHPEKYIDLLVDRWIPTVAITGLAEFCDVFCDRGAFTVAQSRKILMAGRAGGLVPRIHAEQLANTGASRLAIEVSAASADHLEKISANDIRQLGVSNVCCTLLPGCCFHLGLEHYAPARKLIDAGAILGLATDFNPGTSPTLSMPMILSLACTQMRMTPAEAITAATINPAYSLRVHDRVGSLEVGKFADFAAFDVADYREIPYYFGVNFCSLTMKRGAIIHSKKS